MSHLIPNLDNIIAADTIHPVVRLQVALLARGGGSTLGHWLKGLSDGDLKTLNALAGEIIEHEEGDVETPEFKVAAQSVLTLSFVLAQMEGLETTDDGEQVAQRLNMVCMLVAMESLYRKGLINFHRENATLGTDADDKPLASLKEDPAP